jgi:hypothetical protein
MSCGVLSLAILSKISVDTTWTIPRTRCRSASWKVINSSVDASSDGQCLI